MITEAARKAWLEERRKGIGASEVAAIIAPEFAYEGPLALWLDKTGRRAPSPDDARMTAGRYHEPAVAHWFADEYGVKVIHNGDVSHVSPRFPHLRATPDYTVYCEKRGRGPLECKCRFHPGDVQEFADKEPHLRWQIQTQVQMECIPGGATWGAVAALVVGDHVAWALGRNDLFVERIGEAVERWWHDYVELDTPPPDGSEGVEEWLLAYVPPKREPIVVELDDVATAAALKVEPLRLERLRIEKLEKSAKATVIKAIGTADIGVGPGVKYALELPEGEGRKNRSLKLVKEG